MTDEILDEDDYNLKSSMRRSSQSNADRNRHPGSQSGLNVGASRNTYQQRVSAKRKENSKTKMETEIRRHKMEAKKRREASMSEENNKENVNSDTRRKIHIIPRPDDPPATSEKSSYPRKNLYVKKIDEARGRPPLSSEQRAARDEQNRIERERVEKDKNNREKLRALKTAHKELRNTERNVDNKSTAGKKAPILPPLLDKRIVPETYTPSEENFLMSERNFGLPESLINSVKDVIEAKTSKIDLNPKTNEKLPTNSKVKDKNPPQINETLSVNDPIENWIDDFINSDNTRFAGKSPKERRDMAVAAYYAKQRSSHRKEEKENPCWDGYKQVGMKNKGGKKVPNCVPESTDGILSDDELSRLDEIAKEIGV